MKKILPLSVIALLALFWRRSFFAGFQLEDSWLLKHRFISVVDVVRWFTEARDSLGYYRPVRRLFLALLSLPGEQPSATLAHLAIFACFTALIWVMFRLYEEILGSPWASGMGVLLFGLGSYAGKSLYWPSASQNIFVALFGVLSLLSRRAGKNWLSLLWLFLAIASRENAVGLVLPLLWIDYKRGEWKKSWDALLLCLLVVIFLLRPFDLPHNGADATLHFRALPGFTPAWISALLAYFTQLSTPRFITHWPDFLDFPVASLVCAAAVLAWSCWASVDLLRRRKEEALFGLLLAGGLLSHLATPAFWNPEYVLLAATGFFGLVAAAMRDAFTQGRRAPSVVAALAFCTIFAVQAERAHWVHGVKRERLDEWAEGLLALEKTLPAGEVLVIENTETLGPASGLAQDLVYYPNYLEYRLPARAILWDTERLPLLTEAMQHHNLNDPRVPLWYGGANAHFASERGGQWSARLGKIKSPPPAGEKGP